jgi:arylsulfatase A-like enzyme
MKAIVFLFDTLCRRYLPCYGNDWVRTPNFTRFADRSVVFDNHWVGSAPCVPARRDLFTGRLNFLERNWGPIEPFDYTLPQALREQGIFTHMVTDHYHYWRRKLLSTV